ncbi:MAG: hypothetical protein H7839_03930 [Magnetococcus sp. YQC-5]
MTVSPQQYLAIAQTLLQHQDEMHDRSATNRAYYGAFHACKNLASTFNLDQYAKGRGTHHRLITALQHIPLSDQEGPNRDQTLRIRQVGVLLPTIKSLREAADYNIVNNYPEKHAERAVQLSQEIIHIVDQLCTTT